MKNNSTTSLQRKERNRILISKVFLILFQLHIYFGVIIFIYLLTNSVLNNINIPIHLIYLGLTSPLVVCLSLYYKKKILFRIWYMVSVMFIIGFAYSVGDNPAIFLIPGVIIIFLLFKLKYIQEKFN